MEAGRQVSLFPCCRQPVEDTPPPAPPSPPPPPAAPPPPLPPCCCWFQEAEAGMLECFQKSLGKFDRLAAETQTAEKHDGE